MDGGVATLMVAGSHGLAVLSLKYPELVAIVNSPPPTTTTLGLPWPAACKLGAASMAEAAAVCLMKLLLVMVICISLSFFVLYFPMLSK